MKLLNCLQISTTLLFIVCLSLPKVDAQENVEKSSYRRSNCYEIWKTSAFSAPDGLYSIYIVGGGWFEVYCEMRKGGWTRILNRVDRNVAAFNRTWVEYKRGFGDNVEGNDWLGLRAMELLTSREKMSIRLEISNNESDEEWIEYDWFLIMPESNKFKIRISKDVRGTLPEQLSKLNDQIFDVPGSGSGNTCPLSFAAGWWYLNCYSACLTCTSEFGSWYHPNHQSGSGPTNMYHTIFHKMMLRPSGVSNY